uniref:Uncharacterized protein n=1 Tax=Lutzomyia longipalpis TaxID=7200 RepID=A0A1B0CHG8_LUTLO
MEAAEFFQERDHAMEAAEEVLIRKKAYEARVRQLERKVQTYLESLEGNVSARELQEVRDVYRRKFGFLKNLE